MIRVREQTLEALVTSQPPQQTRSCIRRMEITQVYDRNVTSSRAVITDSITLTYSPLMD